jgi:hypothetical protein
MSKFLEPMSTHIFQQIIILLFPPWETSYLFLVFLYLGPCSVRSERKFTSDPTNLKLFSCPFFSVIVMNFRVAMTLLLKYAQNHGWKEHLF